MTPTVNPDTAQHWLDLAAGYGPTFFSMLFLLEVTRWSYSKWNKAVTREDHPADLVEKRTLMRTFVASFIVGVVLTGLSLIWFFFYKPKLYVFTGEIDNLQAYELVNSNDAYLRVRPLASLGKDEPPRRNEEFALISRDPFAKGQTFHFFFRKDNADRNSLDLIYDPADKLQQFTVDLDEKSGKLKFMRVWRQAQAQQELGSLFGGVAYAQERHAEAPAMFRPQTKKVDPSNTSSTAQSTSASFQPSQTDENIQILQTSGSSVGSKLTALDHLSGIDQSRLTADLGSKAGSETQLLGATLLDLTRHSDKEIAFHATTILKKAQVDEYVKIQLSSKNSQEREIGQQLLNHYDKDHAQALLSSLLQSSTKEQKVEPQWTNLAIVPVAFPEGDRYYIQTSWSPDNPTQVNCLAKLFSEELASLQTVNQELATIKDRNQRLIYSVDKDSVTDISLKLSQCGAGVAFVHPSSATKR